MLWGIQLLHRLDPLCHAIVGLNLVLYQCLDLLLVLLATLYLLAGYAYRN